MQQVKVVEFTFLIALFLAVFSCNTTKPGAKGQKKQVKLFEPEVVFIQGGTFNMGSAEGDEDENIHTVTLSSFRLGKYEVTNAQFCQFLNEKGNQRKDSATWIKIGGEWKGEKCRILQNGLEFTVESGFEIYPVTYISWDAAEAYCKWLSGKTGKQYRLPTEAEWEFAAGNGIKHTKYSWGNGGPSGLQGGNVADESLKKKLPDWKIFDGYDDGFYGCAPVGSFSANELGLYDMTGNVWEWCNDWEDKYAQTNQQNPAGALSGKKKIIRGGGWLGWPFACRIADRYSDVPEHRGHSMGFRVAMTLLKK